MAVGIQGFERRLENLIEGTFARVFRSGLNPVELGRKLVRTLDDKRSVGVNGRVIVPNDFTFVLAEDDYEQMADMAGVLARDLGDAAREHARDMGYSFAAVSYTHLDVYKRQPLAGRRRRWDVRTRPWAASSCGWCPTPAA